MVLKDICRKNQVVSSNIKTNEKRTSDKKNKYFKC
mgnify:CR=1 FL=1